MVVVPSRKRLLKPRSWPSVAPRRTDILRAVDVVNVFDVSASMKSSVIFKVAVDCLEVPERFLRVAGNAQVKIMDFQDLSSFCRLVVNVTQNNVDACADCTSELGA